MNTIRKNKRNRKGLTLIELLVTVLILGILAAVAIPLYTSSIANSKEKVAGANRKTVLAAVQAKVAQGGTYSAIATGLTAGTWSATLPDLAQGVTPPDGCGSYTFTGTASKFTVADTCGTDSIGA